MALQRISGAPGPVNMLRWESGFLVSVALILGITGLLKITSVLGPADGIPLPDPLFYMIEQRHMLLGVGILEVAVAAFVLLGESRQGRLTAILWLGCLFLAYRFGLFFIGFRGNCLCLGKPRSWMMAAEGKQIDRGLFFLLLYMVAFSALLLLRRSRLAAEPANGSPGGSAHPGSSAEQAAKAV